MIIQIFVQVKRTYAVITHTYVYVSIIRQFFIVTADHRQ